MAARAARMTAATGSGGERQTLMSPVVLSTGGAGLPVGGEEWNQSGVQARAGVRY